MRPEPSGIDPDGSGCQCFASMWPVLSEAQAVHPQVRCGFAPGLADEGGQGGGFLEAEAPGQIRVERDGRVAGFFEAAATGGAVVVDAAQAEFFHDEADGGAEHGLVPPLAGKAEALLPVAEDEGG